MDVTPPSTDTWQHLLAERVEKRVGKAKASDATIRQITQEEALAIAADLVRWRRRFLDVTQAEAASQANVSLATWGLIERNQLQSWSKASRRALTLALDWPEVFIEALLAGDYSHLDDEYGCAGDLHGYGYAAKSDAPLTAAQGEEIIALLKRLAEDVSNALDQPANTRPARTDAEAGRSASPKTQSARRVRP